MDIQEYREARLAGLLASYGLTDASEEEKASFRANFVKRAIEADAMLLQDIQTDHGRTLRYIQNILRDTSVPLFVRLHQFEKYRVLPGIYPGMSPSESPENHGTRGRHNLYPEESRKLDVTRRQSLRFHGPLPVYPNTNKDE